MLKFYLLKQSSKKYKNNLTIHKNSKKLQKKGVNFALISPENFPLGFLSVLRTRAGVGEKGRLMRAERRLLVTRETSRTFLHQHPNVGL